MCFLLSTTPAKKHKSRRMKTKKASLTDKVIAFCILIIWGLLISFALISIYKPVWLINISEPGKSGEAIKYKKDGDRFLKKEDYPQAVFYYQKALKMQPDHNEALGNLGIVYSKIKKYNKAISIFKKLIEQEPKLAYVSYLNIADIYENKKDLANSIKYYSKAAESAPFPFYAYTKLGNLYCISQDWDSAIRAFQRAIENRTNMLNYYEGMLKRDLHRLEDEQGMKETIQTAIENGVTEKELKYYDKAIFDKSLNRDKEYAKTHSNLGWAYVNKNDLSNAIFHYKIALNIWPGFKQAQNNLNDAIKKQQKDI